MRRRSFTVGPLAASSANNIALSQTPTTTVTLNGSTVTASVAAAGGAQTAISGIIASDATYTSGTVSFSNQANITIGSSVNGATQYIRLSGNANLTDQQGQFCGVKYERITESGWGTVGML